MSSGNENKKVNLISGSILVLSRLGLVLLVGGIVFGGVFSAISMIANLLGSSLSLGGSFVLGGALGMLAAVIVLAVIAADKDEASKKKPKKGMDLGDLQ